MAANSLCLGQRQACAIRVTRLNAACTNCGRCIDVCSKDVFRLTHRFDLRRD